MNKNVENKCNLTVIIPFLNEGIEVYNTVKNLRENADEKFDIVLLNDASSDGFDYKQIAIDFQAQYIEHAERKGVAASRDEGIDRCKTECFLLLDAHMRVYQKDWVSIIVEAIQKDSRALFCCKTIMLDKTGVIGDSAITGCGAYFNMNDLSITWITGNGSQPDLLIDIPCVLGASYACNKTYWQYLKGLHGLQKYGLDEQLISLKVWMEGGRCRLISNVAFGHIFRQTKQVAREIDDKSFIYNKLYIVELLFGTIQQSIDVVRGIRKRYGIERVDNAVQLLAEKGDEIRKEKQYYQKIFTRDINFIIEQNTNRK
jgi:glycosyltransferase involved in cell wall biosynthesis